MDRDLMTEDEAKSKYCPRISANCLASDCMFWRKEEPYYVYAKEPPGDDWSENPASGWGFGKEGEKEWMKIPDGDKGKCGVRY